jgi:hypothetical protein
VPFRRAPVDRLDDPSGPVDAEFERIGIPTPPVDEAIELRQNPVPIQLRLLEWADERLYSLDPAHLGSDPASSLPAADGDEAGSENGAGGKADHSAADDRRGGEPGGERAHETGARGRAAQRKPQIQSVDAPMLPAE